MKKIFRPMIKLARGITALPILDWERVSTFFNSLRIRLMMYFIVISMVVLAVGSYLSYKNMLEMLEERNQTLVLQQLAQTEQNILNLMSDANRLLASFQLEESVQRFLELEEYAYIYENVEMVRKIQSSADQKMINYPYIDSIYLFTKNREVIGSSKGNSLTARKGQPEHPFFATELYSSVDNADTQARWYGGYDQVFFNEALAIFNTNKSRHLITMVKGIRTLNFQSVNGIFVMNINQEHVAKLFEKLGNEGEEAYIVDSKGNILSSAKTGDIGTTSDFFTSLDRSKPHGSTILREDQNPRQIIYYKIDSLNWYILRSVPLQIGSEYSVSLQKTFIISLLLSIFAIFIVSLFWLKRITKPLDKLAKKMADVGQGNLGLTLRHIPRNELGVVIKGFNEMSLNIADLIEKNKEMEKDKRDLEIEALQAQINPHFLYNTLNMVRWMATVIKANNIVDCLIALGNILQPVFKNDDNTMCSIKDEITYLENYVKIMNWRFGNSITFKMQVNDKLTDYKIPRFILQPLVENSITHGFKNGEGAIEIAIQITEEGEDLLISVTDTGAGIHDQKLSEINRLLYSAHGEKMKDSNNGIGIYNVNRRIKLYFGDAYGIRLESPEEGGTRVLLRINKIY